MPFNHKTCMCHNEVFFHLTVRKCRLTTKTARTRKCLNVVFLHLTILSYSVVTSPGCVSSWCFFTFTVRIPSCTAFSCSSRCPFEFARYSHRSQGHTFFHSSSVDSEDLLCSWLLVTFRARLSCVYFNFY